MKDRRGIARGRCNEIECPCFEYEVDGVSNLCSYCGHIPMLHAELFDMRCCPNISENTKQNNDLQEEVLEETSSVSEDHNSSHVITDWKLSLACSSNSATNKAFQMINEDLSSDITSPPPKQGFTNEYFKNMDKLLEALHLTKDLRSTFAMDIIPGYLLHPKTITHEVQRILNSTIYDLRASFSSLLQKIKKLGVKSCQDLVDFLKIPSKNEDGVGSIIQEGIPESIPARDGPCLYLMDVKKSSQGVVYVSEGKVIEFKKLSIIDGLIIVFGVYYILNLNYPDAFSQVLGLMQIMFKKEIFPRQYWSNNLQRIVEITFLDLDCNDIN